ncbi:hypothetical protein CMK14_00665 [Candidatus Poribacteria bacterium]|nr:hypothetical protein [Candidatus Poribacteria bacterium]
MKFGSISTGRSRFLGPREPEAVHYDRMSVTQNQRRVVVDEIKQAMTIQVDPVDTLTSIYVDREEGIYAPVRVLPPGSDSFACSDISHERRF